MVLEEGTAKNSDQAVAICASMYKNRNKSKSIIDQMNDELKKNKPKE